MAPGAAAACSAPYWPSQLHFSAAPHYLCWPSPSPKGALPGPRLAMMSRSCLAIASFPPLGPHHPQEQSKRRRGGTHSYIQAPCLPTPQSLLLTPQVTHPKPPHTTPQRLPTKWGEWPALTCPAAAASFALMSSCRLALAASRAPLSSICSHGNWSTVSNHC